MTDPTDLAALLARGAARAAAMVWTMCDGYRICRLCRIKEGPVLHYPDCPFDGITDPVLVSRAAVEAAVQQMVERARTVHEHRFTLDDALDLAGVREAADDQ